MKKFRIDSEHLIRVLILVLVMTSTITVLELYVPLKRMIAGDKMMPGEVWNYINLGRSLPYILLCSIVFGLYSGKQDNEKAE